MHSEGLFTIGSSCTLKQRRQCMRFVVIVEKNFCVIAKAARVPELVDFEDVIDARCVVTQKFARHFL